MNNGEYWIWLSRTLGEGARIDDIINYFGSAKALYEAGRYEWKISGLLTPRQVENLVTYSPSESGKIINTCAENHWQIITPDDENYPARLREICDYPAVIYADGDTNLLSECLPIAMVGTRKASGYGVRVASTLASMLAKAGLTVVSGGALGIDSAAHTGAMYAGGKTVAVLGCGIGTDYLRENEAMRHEISKNGVLITEYPPFTAASKFTFPKRNRIISGMSIGTVVVEAGERSGSLITARLAVEQGRDVFAVPGDVFSSAFSGANKLIHDGAKPVFTARDIVEEYYHMYPGRIIIENSDEPLAKLLSESDKSRFNNINVAKKHNIPVKKQKESGTGQEEKPVAKKQLPAEISEAAKAVYAAIESVTSFDDICRVSGVGIAKVLSGITELEMKSFIEVLPGRKYKKI